MRRRGRWRGAEPPVAQKKMAQETDGTYTCILGNHPPEAAMKTKLTLTIDEDVVPRAKRYAQGRGVSLSSIVEKTLRDLTHEAPPAAAADPWRGRSGPASRDEARFRALARKLL